MRYLITGGSGTLGSELIRQLLKKHKNEFTEIISLSRTEANLARVPDSPKVTKVLGDIRDYWGIEGYFRRVDRVIHCAALKHVDLGEKFADEFIKTNIKGTINVRRACDQYDVSLLVFSTTDKAVKPINVYGHTKAIAEHVVSQRKMPWLTFRWGNVLGSNGSAIPYFIECVRDGKSINLTDEEMTRFWITIEDAASFMLANLGQEGKVLYPTIRSASVVNIINSIARILDRTPKMKVVGLRPGEKIHEDMNESLNSFNAQLLSAEELDKMLTPIVRGLK